MSGLFSLGSMIYALVLIIASFVVFWALRKHKVSKETLFQLKQILKIYKPQVPPGEIREVIDALVTVLSYYTGEGATKKDLEVALQKLQTLDLGITWERHIAKLKR